MKCIAVIDTNVLVSALLSVHDNAATVVVVRKVLTGEIIPLLDVDIIAEYEDVLKRKKFGFSHVTIETLIGVIKKFGIYVKRQTTDTILLDMNDLPFYEVVLEKKKEGAYLITGNKKHFPIRSFIVTPREILGILEKHYEI